MELYIPKNWSEINVKTFIELIDIKVENYKNNFEYKIEIISLLNDIANDDDIFEELDITELDQLLNSIKWLFNEPNNKLKNCISQYKLKNLNDLTLGEFIDIDYYFRLDSIKNIHLIAAILYKKIKIDEWENEIIEPYIYNIYNRSELFLNESINDIYGIIKYFYDFKESIINNYSNIFKNYNEEIIDKENLDIEEIQEIEKEIEEDKKKGEFSWQIIIYNLCNGDLSKFNDIVNLPLIYVLNTLSLKKSFNL